MCVCGGVFIRFLPITAVSVKETPLGRDSISYATLEEQSPYHETEPLSSIYFIHNPKETIASKRRVYPTKMATPRMVRQATYNSPVCKRKTLGIN